MADSRSTPSSDAAFTTLSLKAGDKVDHFTVVDTIATTGSAVVYKAHDDLLDRHVAIKQIILGQEDSDDALRKRIRDEAAIHKRVSTTQPKHLIQFIDAVDDSRGLMLVSEYYPSTSLEELLEKSPASLDERQALGIVAATAKGLEAIHEAGVVHRDLKPSNVLLGNDGGLKICDFGLSALIESQDSLSLGSVRYMAPELLKSEPADGRADVYSLGIMAYEMLAGRANFDVAFRNVLRDQRNQAMRWMKWHTNARVTAPRLDEYLPDLPNHLVQLVARMMDKDQARRVGSAKDVVQAIRRHFTGDGPDTDLTPHAGIEHPGITTSSPGDTAPLPSRNRLPLILGALLVFWVVVGTALFVINDQKKTAAQERALAEANALIQDGIEQYNEGAFALSLEKYEAVLATWPAESGPAMRAQLGAWKASGRLAMQEQRYDQAVGFFEQYRDNGGNASSVEQLISDARDAEAFAQLSTSVDQKIVEEAFGEAQQIIREARATRLTDAQTRRLDELETQVAQRRAEVLAARRIAEANRLVEAGDRPAAITALGDASTLPEEGQALLKQLREDEAYDNAIAQGKELERSGKIGEAIDAYRVALDLRPDVALAARLPILEARQLTEQGTELFAAGEFESASDRFTQALEKDPENADALRLKQQIAEATELSTIIARGDAAAGASDFAAAILEYEKALAVTPTNADVLAKLNRARVNQNLADAQVAIRQADSVKARALLEAVLELDADNAVAKKMLEQMNQEQQYQKLLAQGDESMKSADFPAAKRFFREAAKIKRGDEIDERTKDADYASYIAQARSYIADERYNAARGFLQLAREIRFTDELATLLEQVEAATTNNSSP